MPGDGGAKWQSGRLAFQKWNLLVHYRNLHGKGSRRKVAASDGMEKAQKSAGGDCADHCIARIILRSLTIMLRSLTSFLFRKFFSDKVDKGEVSLFITTDDNGDKYEKKEKKKQRKRGIRSFFFP